MDAYESPEIYPSQNCNNDKEINDVVFASEDDTTKDTDAAEDDVCDCENEEMSIEDYREYNQQLRDRIIMLRTTLYDLKKQLKDEREGWKREIQLLNAVPNDNFVENLKNFRNLTYEEINQLHQESKAQLQRQLAITNYKRRLLEVENMCNMELMRVKQSVKFLQPLQMMISEWNLDSSSSATNTSYVDQTGDHLSPTSSTKDILSDTDLKSKDSNIPLEMIGTKLYNDMNDMFNVLSAHCQETIPNWKDDNTLQSQSSTNFSDCGQSELM